MHRFANPLRYQRIADAVLPWAGGAAIALALVGLYLALFVAPADYQQGEAYRIMFVHVPAAWMALLVYAMMAIASVVGLVWRHPLAEVAARAIRAISDGASAVEKPRDADPAGARTIRESLPLDSKVDPVVCKKESP